MRTSTLVFDRAGSVLGRPFVLGQLAGTIGLDPDRTRRLVGAAAAILVVGLAERMGAADSTVREATAELLAVSARVVGPCRSWPLDGRLPDAAELDGDRVAVHLLGSDRPRRIADLARRGDVTADVAALLMARIAPVIASAAAEIRTELDLSDAEFSEQLAAEGQTLADLGFVDPSTGGGVDVERAATVTRNVVKHRVAASSDDVAGGRAGGRRSALPSSWIWWAVFVVVSIVVVAVLIAVRRNDADGEELQAGAASSPAPAFATTIAGSGVHAINPTENGGGANNAPAVGDPAGAATVVDPGDLVIPPTSVEGPTTATTSAAAPPSSVTAGISLNAVLGLGPIPFESRSAVLTAHGETVVDRVATFLIDHPDVRLEVAGHTDSDGRASENMALSRARAEAVVERLAAAGVDSERLVAVGHGETSPVVPNNSAANKAANRRIDFVIL